MSNNQQQFKYSTGVIAYPLFFVLSLWIVFWAQVRFFPSIKRLGVYPQKLEGLLGIMQLVRLYIQILNICTTIVFHCLFCLLLVFYFYRKISWKVILYGILLSGLFTWVIGRPANHIGASGLVYVLVSFIFFKGIFAKHYRLVALSLIISISLWKYDMVCFSC